MGSNRKKLLIPDTMVKAGWEVLRQRDDIEAVKYAPSMPTPAFHALLEDAAGVALSLTPFRGPELTAAPLLEVVTRLGVGYDLVDVPALTTRRIPMMVVGTANSVTVAEQAMYFMMTLAKRGPAMEGFVRQGRWADKFIDRPVELGGRMLLVIGFGRIGTRIARRCLAMEMTVLVYDPYVSAETIRAAGCEPIADLDAAIPRADFITLHCPKTAETSPLFDARRLALMKPEAYLVNTARGGIVDETALHTALTAGQLAGAGLDVFVEEPVPTGHPLLALPNVAVSPHCAGGTIEAGDRSAVNAVRNLLSVLDGAPIREHVINPEVLG
jgi:D-3-phosphoglycerate dehydrogenase